MENASTGCWSTLPIHHASSRPQANPVEKPMFSSCYPWNCFPVLGDTSSHAVQEKPTKLSATISKDSDTEEDVPSQCVAASRCANDTIKRRIEEIRKKKKSKPSNLAHQMPPVTKYYPGTFCELCCIRYHCGIEKHCASISHRGTCSYYFPVEEFEDMHCSRQFWTLELCTKFDELQALVKDFWIKRVVECPNAATRYRELAALSNARVQRAKGKFQNEQAILSKIFEAQVPANPSPIVRRSSSMLGSADLAEYHLTRAPAGKWDVGYPRYPLNIEHMNDGLFSLFETSSSCSAHCMARRVYDKRLKDGSETNASKIRGHHNTETQCQEQRLNELWDLRCLLQPVDGCLPGVSFGSASRFPQRVIACFGDPNKSIKDDHPDRSKAHSILTKALPTKSKWTRSSGSLFSSMDKDEDLLLPMGEDIQRLFGVEEQLENPTSNTGTVQARRTSQDFIPDETPELHESVW